MVRTSIEDQRKYDDDRFSAEPIFRNDRVKVVCAYFEPGQFIPVHAPGSEVVIAVFEGQGLVRDGIEEHHVEPADVVVVPAGTDRGIRASSGGRLEALLVVTPPPSEADHEAVRKGLATGAFDPT